MNDQKKYDFVIYGASGFTGKLVVEYAIAKYLDSEDISWAIAGRNLNTCIVHQHIQMQSY